KVIGPTCSTRPDGPRSCRADPPAPSARDRDAGWHTGTERSVRAGPGQQDGLTGVVRSGSKAAAGRRRLGRAGEFLVLLEVELDELLGCGVERALAGRQQLLHIQPHAVAGVGRDVVALGVHPDRVLRAGFDAVAAVDA